jgi:transcriptional regulator with XRE-family HTH domain
MIALIQRPGLVFDRDSFGSAIRRICDVRDAIGAAKLARLLNVSRFTAYAWMRGGSIPSLRTLHSLCRGLDVSLEALLYGLAGDVGAPLETAVPKGRLVFLRREPANYQALRIAIQAEIEKTNPLTARQLAIQNRVDPATLRRANPEAYRKLVQHHKVTRRRNAEQYFQGLMKEVAAACDTIRDSGKAITRRRIASFLPKKGGVLQSKPLRSEIQMLLRQWNADEPAPQSPAIET